MAMLTVVGTKLAKKDNVIIFLDSLSECKDCKVKNICFHLDRGCRYKIVGLRGVKHDCKVHEDGVMVVEVEKQNMDAALEKKLAIEGSKTTVNLPNCNDLSCKNYDLCFPIGLKSGMKRQILKCGKEFDCPQGEKRVIVTLD